MSKRIEELKRLSEESIDEVFRWVLDSDAPIVEVSSPPGGGKSTLLVELGLYLAIEHKIQDSRGPRAPKLVILTQSHAQAVSLISRFLDSHSSLGFKVVGAAGKQKRWPDRFLVDERFHALPAGRGGIDDLKNERADDEQGAMPQIMVTNRSKADSLLAHYPELQSWFDFGFIDEAYQMRYCDFLFTLNLAERWVAVGDPGQLDPIKGAEPYDLAYVDYGARPYLPMPKGAAEDGVAIQKVPLPVSWRLPQDTVDIIQPAFYKDLVFKGAGEAGRRKLHLSPARIGDSLDRLLDAVSSESRTLQMLALPAQAPSSGVDDELHAHVVELIKRLLKRRAEIEDEDVGGGRRSIGSKDILVLASRVNQVADLQAKIELLKDYQPIDADVVSAEGIASNGAHDPLGDLSFTDEQELFEAMIRRRYIGDESALVDTANRLQGLEAPIVIAVHPCSGLEKITDYDLEIGRLCVMLTRHRIACILVSRASVVELLAKPYLSMDRGLKNDPAQEIHEGLQAHRALLNALHEQGRIW